MRRLTLYTTQGCHLCEQLEAELARLAVPDIALERIEIAHDDALVARYGMRIPVLSEFRNDELERGFETDRLAAWLGARGLLATPAEARQADASPVPGARRVRGRRFLR